MALLQMLLMAGLAATAATAADDAVGPPSAAAAALPAGGQVAAASALIGRIVGPARAAAFKLSLAPAAAAAAAAGGADTFSVAAGPCCSITGTNGVALASGFNWYLKYVAKREVAYPLSGEPMLNVSTLPTTWPPVPQALTQTSVFKWRYYMNVVTHSYSAAFWDAERWMQEVDWMALSGVNLPLAFTGQEWAFYRTYTEQFGLTAADLDAHFAGPAFLAWGRMGNIRAWGGTYLLGVISLTVAKHSQNEPFDWYFACISSSAQLHDG